MKILITTGIFEPEIGGPAGYAPKLAAGLVARGHDVKVLTYSDKPSYDFDREYPFTLERIVRTSKIANYIRFFRAVFGEAPNYDLIYSLDWFSAGLPVALAARIKKKKYILRIGGGYLWEKYLNEGNPPMTLRAFCAEQKYRSYPMMYRLMRFVLRGAHAIVFNTDIQRIFYAPHYGLVPRRLTTVYNPVPMMHFRVERTAAKKEIVFAGRMTVKNNIETLLRAFDAAKLPDYTLMLIGGGFLVEPMKALAEKLNLKNTRFHPAMRQQELYERIKNCRYVILPSWTDISPNTAYECLALGIPFLLTKENYLSIWDKIPYMVNPASIEDIAEKIHLLADESVYNEYCAALKKIEFRHGWEDVYDQHEKILQKCLQ